MVWLFVPVGLMLGCGPDRQHVATRADSQVASPPDFSKPISFAGTSSSSAVTGLRGFAQPEPFGRWTNRKVALIDFNGPLPDRFDLDLSAAAFGPNVGAETLVVIGAKSYAVRIQGDLSAFKTYTIAVENPLGERSIAFVVPHPVAPEDVGKGTDSRPLGIALGALTIRLTEGSPKPNK